MRKIITGGIAVALGVATAVASGAFAAGQPQVWVNGGGQLIEDGATGAGDTIAFVAQELADGSAQGQLQYTPHTEGDLAKFHGVVTCVDSLGGDNEAGGTGTFGGFVRGSDQAFRVDVTDSGRGNQGTDVIQLSFVDPEDDESPCDPDQQGAERHLGRGNVTIHNNTD